MPLVLGRLAILAAILGFWEFASGRLINPLFISRPSRIAATVWEWLLDGSLLYHAAITASTRTPAQLAQHTEHRKKAGALGRLGTLAERAGTVLFSASDEASSVAGQTLSVDGGRFDRM